MDIPDALENTSKDLKKAPKMKNLRRGSSFNHEEIDALLRHQVTNHFLEKTFLTITYKREQRLKFHEFI